MKENTETGKVGARGTVVIPARMRRRLGIDEGDLVIIEEQEQGVLIRRAVAVPVEIYTPERKAEFLLSNAIGKRDYNQARKEVRKMGLDPDKIPHYKPSGDK
jgi:AbrB family looped-hinge helix DNA binding protein